MWLEEKGNNTAHINLNSYYFQLVVMTYWSIHSTSLSYLQSCFTCVSDMTSRRRLQSSTLNRLEFPPVRLSSRQAGVSGFWCKYGTTCLSSSHLRRHSRFSENDSWPLCFPIPTKTLSYHSSATITIHHNCLVVLAIIIII